MSGAKAMLAAAREDLGLVGRPNHITREYAKNNGPEYLSAPWCDMSVTHWARRSGNAEAVLPEGDRAYTVAHAEDGRQLRRWFAGTADNIRRHLKPGAIVFMAWEGTDRIADIDHVGVAEVNLGDGRVQTIEGNTGDACKRRVRGPSVIAGFWNPDYSKQEDDMPLTDADAKKVAKEVLASLTHTITKDTWAGREGIFPIGQKIDPKSGLRQTWAYGKDTNQRVRALQAQLAVQNATISELAKALAERDSAVDPDALVARIQQAISGITIHLDTTHDTTP